MKNETGEPVHPAGATSKTGLRLRRATGPLVTLALILYPILVYTGLSTWGIGITAPLLLAAFALRIIQTRPRIQELFWVTTATSATGAALVTIAWISRNSGYFLYYPVAVSLILLTLFASTLRHPPSIIERIARLTDPNLPPAAIAYTEKVTRAWCAFFIFNTLAALATCLHGDLQLWTLYNGAISYILMGALISTEWLTRRRLQRRIRREQQVLENQ